MKDTNIKCNNKTEAYFAIKYLLDKGCKWYIFDKERFELGEFKYPLIFYNGTDDLKNVLYLTNSEDFPNFFKIIEAKHLMRTEKLKRIQ